MDDKARHRRRRAQKELRRLRAHCALIASLINRLRWRPYRGHHFNLDQLRRQRSRHLKDEGKNVKRGKPKRRRSHWNPNDRLRRLRNTEPYRDELLELAYLGPAALVTRSLRHQSRRLPLFGPTSPGTISPHYWVREPSDQGRPHSDATPPLCGSGSMVEITGCTRYFAATRWTSAMVTALRLFG